MANLPQAVPATHDEAMAYIDTHTLFGRGIGYVGAAVVSLDNVITIPTTDLGRQIGLLLTEQEAALTEAIRAAFDLD